MALPGSGPISMNDVNTEIRKSATSQRDLNDADVRLTFDKPSGDISLNDGYGKCFCTEYSIIYDNSTGLVEFEALSCNENRSFIQVSDNGTGGDPWGTVCVVKNSLSTVQNLLNYTNNGCC